MIPRRAALAVLTASLLAAPAMAQTTTPAADPAAPVATTDRSATDAQIRAWINDAPPPTIADPRDVVVDKPSQPQIHGEAGITIGSGGYRSVYGVAVMPLGDSATLGVAASDTSFGKTRWSRGGRSQSLALSLAAGDLRTANAPDGCLLVDGRYVEPLWATRLRGPDDHCALSHGGRAQPPRP